MHYKNGRPALPGDKVINLTTGHAGVLHSVNAQSETCNGHVVAITQGDHYVTISDCLHQDDIAAADYPGFLRACRCRSRRSTCRCRSRRGGCHHRAMSTLLTLLTLMAVTSISSCVHVDRPNQVSGKMEKQWTWIGDAPVN